MIRIFDELRDAWAIALAMVTAFVAWFVGAPVAAIVGAGGAVLGARVIAGIAFPLSRPTILPLSILTRYERHIATLIAGGMTPELIAAKKRVSHEAIVKTYDSILRKLEYRHPWEIRAWAITVGLVQAPPRPSLLRRIIDSTLLRATLAAGGLIGLGWTLYQIWRTSCPSLRLVLPWLPDCP